MTKTSAFAKSIVIGTSFGALLWAIIFLLQPSDFPISFWLRTGWFWKGVVRGALAGWVLGAIVGAIILLLMVVKNRLRRTEEESH
jgi:Na+/proline symporter